jgi:archaellum component FlaC
MKEGKELKAPNIVNITRWSNNMTRWVAAEIVSVKDSVKARAQIMERFIKIAEQLRKLQNFNGVKELVAGLQSSAIYRLKRTRNSVGQEYNDIFNSLTKLISSDLNFKNLRSQVRESSPPLIPFPGTLCSIVV